MSEVVARALSQRINDLQMVRLGDHLNVIRGASPRPKGDPRYFGGDIPWISISDITREPGKYLSRTREFVTRAGAEKSRLLPAGTLILSNSGTVCVPKILRVDGCIHDGFVAFPDLPHSLDKNYLYWFFEYVRPSIIEANRQGITQVNLNTGIVREIRLPLTSIERQREIVAELEKRFSRLEEAVANLQRVKANLKRYKASVLKAAVEGRLVETEASLARREGRTYETGEQLLQRILEERRAKWVGKGKYKEPDPTNVSDLGELPEGWTWVSAVQACEQVVDCHNKTAPYTSTGIPLIRTTNIKDGRLLLEDTRYVDQPTYEFWSRRCPPESGDVLFTREAPMGEAGIIPPGVKLCLGQRTMLMRPSPAISSSFLLSALLSPVVKDLIDRVAVGSGVKHLRVGDVERLPVPLPPVAEQTRIVAEVDRHLSIIREVEAEVDANLQRAQALRQSTLRSAFSCIEGA